MDHIYILCSYQKSDYAESAHHVCHFMRQYVKTYPQHATVRPMIAYIGGNRSTPSLYPSFEVEVCGLVDIEDVPTNVVVLFDIFAESRFRSECHVEHCQIVIWWHSLVHAVLNNTMANLDSPSTFHAFHSVAAYVMLTPYLDQGQKSCFLTDCIVSASSNDGTVPKEDLLCFHEDDHLMQRLVDQHGFAHVLLPPYADSTDPSIQLCLQRSKIYVDLRKHPFKTLIHRYASMHGCVIVTNRSGVASYWDDLPIHEKVTHVHEVVPLIQRIFQDYDTYNQSFLRTQLENEVRVCMNHIGDVVDMTRCSVYQGIQFARHPTYLEWTTKYSHHFEALSMDAQCPLDMIHSRMNVMTLGNGARDVLQIGFDNSALFWLLANDHSRVLCIHASCENDERGHQRFKYLEEMFPSRIEVLVGIPVVALRKYREITDTTFDRVHVNVTPDHTLLEECKRLCSDIVLLENCRDGIEHALGNDVFDDMPMYTTTSTAQRAFRRKFCFNTPSSPQNKT